MRYAAFILVLALTRLAAAQTAPVAVPDHGVDVRVNFGMTQIGAAFYAQERQIGSADAFAGTFLLSDPIFGGLTQAQLDAAGGPGPFIEQNRPRINASLAKRYPGVSPLPPSDPTKAVNFTLGNYRLGFDPTGAVALSRP